ncbi:protein meaA [Rugosimonospora acidiphila]|uniref:Protein meaA n=1 Tax=Rugosimonospora acidiphila TaxID=556531 RepID=A0ABP9RPP8_9ACTN
MSYRLDRRDRPWMMRTYAGHSSAAATNALFRRNLAKGQTGLSVAFDLPTQTGYDPDHELARGEVGRVGVPVAHLGDCRTLFDGIPLEGANTSMTINATAMWLLGLYVSVAQEQGAPPGALAGTVQNDIIKEYLSRGTYIFPPGPSLRLTTDLVAWTVLNVPRWNPVNICSYHLQEAGATPVQEVAFALSTAVALLDAVRVSGQVPPQRFGDVVRRISFFVNAGVRFVEELAKMRAFVTLWDRITLERYEVRDPAARQFRYGVQVNSLGLTEAQPENNVARIVLEMLGVTLCRGARARAVQLPAWNEALGLPRPWDQQWSLRLQQVLAYESDLLEYPDLFAGSRVVEELTQSIVDGASAELGRILDQGGVVRAVETGYLKSALVSSLAERRRRMESGDDVVVGVNRFAETEPSPLTTAGAAPIERIDPGAEDEAVTGIAKWRAARDGAAATRALDRLRADAGSATNLMPATLECARTGVTTGEWAGALREIFGEYRAPTGLSASTGLSAPTGTAAPVDTAASSRPRGPGPDPAPGAGAAGSGGGTAELAEVRARVAATAAELGAGRLRLLVGKPGLDGHSNGAEQIAMCARDAGFEVVYQGIRLTPGQIVAAAVQEDVDVVGLSVLSGAHLEAVPAVLAGLAAAGLPGVPVVVGGVIPAGDASALRAAGVARVFTPKDFGLTGIIDELVTVVREANGLIG